MNGIIHRHVTEYADAKINLTILPGGAGAVCQRL